MLGKVFHITQHWYKSYSILPYKTISGKWCWPGPVYKRVVWKYGYHQPFTEYGNLFDVIKHSGQPYITTYKDVEI